MLTTETELNAIAAEANMGLSNGPPKMYSTPAATGIPVILEKAGEKSVCCRVGSVSRDSRIAS